MPFLVPALKLSEESDVEEALTRARDEIACSNNVFSLLTSSVPGVVVMQ